MLYRIYNYFYLLKTENDLLVILFKEHHKEIMKNFLQTFIKYFVGLQANFSFVAGFIFYIIFIVREYSLDKIFNQTCMDTIANATHTMICPSFLAKNLFFNWKTEILHRKFTLTANAKRIDSTLNLSDDGDSENSAKYSYQMHALDGSSRNQSIHPTYLSHPTKFSPIEDIYLLLISVSLINFFVSLVVPLIFIKANSNVKQTRSNYRILLGIEEKASPISEATLSRLLYKESEAAAGGDESDSGGFLTKNVQKKKHPKMVN